VFKVALVSVVVVRDNVGVGLPEIVRVRVALAVSGGLNESVTTNVSG
jgi:hypothetical protein